ncbi:effector-associated constant component EACC1 [Amycolatopsis sp. NPDC054798]
MASGTVLLTLPGAEDDELRKLAAWLRDEDELRGRVRAQDAPARSGEMGGALEAITVIATSGTATALCRSLFDWLARRRDARKVSLKLTMGEDKLELECGSGDDSAQVLAAVQKFLDQGSSAE